MLARRVAEGKAGSVNIGFTAASSYSYVPELVAACREQLPDVELILKEMVSGDQLKRLGVGRNRYRPAPATDPAHRPAILPGEGRTESRPCRPGTGWPTRRRSASRTSQPNPSSYHAPYEARYFHDLLVELFSRARWRRSMFQHLAQIHSILAIVHAGVGVALVPEAAAESAV